MELPDLKYSYSHSNIESIAIGPCREVTLSISLLEWIGRDGHFSPAKSLRFGGIVNFDEIKEFFGEHQTFQLASLRYSAEQREFK